MPSSPPSASTASSYPLLDAGWIEGVDGHHMAATRFGYRLFKHVAAAGGECNIGAIALKLDGGGPAQTR